MKTVHSNKNILLKYFDVKLFRKKQGVQINIIDNIEEQDSVISYYYRFWHINYQ